ncbi:MAG: RimK/LysX family protein [Planctomycetota bacterium]|nr:RimK/LysX family protein [Planctomycetota bacterium]MDA1113853.1 RimK/LysX family protein [Planctomycetota bacterium]
MRKPPKSTVEPLVIGWREMIELPNWGIAKIKAKVDTGARTSALHVQNLEHLDDEHVRFDVVVREHPLRLVTVKAPLFRVSRVKPTHDRVEERPVVQTKMILGGVEQTIELSLVGRPGMRCRMLLGRRAIADAFLVDARHCYVVSGRSTKKENR